MGQAFGAVLPLAAAVALFPISIVAAVLLVGSERGRVKGLVFICAWCLGLGGVGAAALLLGAEADANADGKRAAWTSVLLLGLGLVLLAAALRQWLKRPGAGEDAPMPEWMRTLDGLSTARAGAAALALTVLNPKNVLLAVAAATEIAQFGLAAGQQVAVLVGFVLVASLGVLAPLVLSVVLGDRSRAPLDALTRFLARHNAVIMTVLFVLVGTKLIGDAISGFSG